MGSVLPCGGSLKATHAKYSMGHPLVSFPKGSPAGPPLPKSQHWPPGHKPQDALYYIEVVKIFHVRVWKKYSD